MENRSDKCGYIDTTAKLVIKMRYDFAEEFSEGLACVEPNEKSGFIDRNGKLVIPFLYDGAFDFENGIAEAERMGQRFYH